MLQSSPLNPRRAIIWLGRLILGPVFIYAGYSKAFLPNHTFWPWFFLNSSSPPTSPTSSSRSKPSTSSRLGSPIRRPHSPVHRNRPWPSLINRMGTPHLVHSAYRHHARLLLRRPTRLPPAHEHQLRLLCHPRTHQSEKDPGRRRHVRASHRHDRLRLHRSPSAPPLDRPRKPETA